MRLNILLILKVLFEILGGFTNFVKDFTILGVQLNFGSTIYIYLLQFLISLYLHSRKPNFNNLIILILSF